MNTYGEKRAHPLALMLDGIGFGIGCAAGGAAFLLLWAYDLTSGMRRGPGGT